ncbi:hypothetical protein C2E23DRAFT_884894 [Lenzites betulinus]|nr:hypothetical protein C2E23DRAFT_884894 [Lenzites betulinus]
MYDSFFLVDFYVDGTSIPDDADRTAAHSETFSAYLDAAAASCGYTGYVKKYATYPPKGPLPLPGKSIEADPGCDLWTEIANAALMSNPAFNVYRIFDTWPILWDVLGFPGSFSQQQSPIYFDRAGECADAPVFSHGDHSAPLAFTVLPRVIEKSELAVIVHGLADFILIAEGTQIVIQNMTWNGKQGFQEPIKADSLIVDGMGALGTAHNERGLTYFEVALSGHMVPQFSLRAGLYTMEYLMGFRKNP